MAVPSFDKRLEEALRRIADLSQFVSEFELRATLKKLEALLDSASADMQAKLFEWMSACHFRLRQSAKSADACRLGLQRLRGASQDRAVMLSNYAAALIDLGRYKDAVAALLEAARIEHTESHVTYANLAEALDRLGLRQDAVDAMDEAVRVADLSQPSHLFVLARQAAEVALDADGVELFVRFLALRHPLATGTPAELIRAFLSDATSASLLNPPLESALRRAIAFADESRRIEDAREEGEPRASPDAIGVWMATAPLRLAAMQKVGGGDAD